MSRKKKIGLFFVLTMTVFLLFLGGDLISSRGGDGVGEVLHGQDRCFRSAKLRTGKSSGAWYHTVSPNEAFTSNRTHTFPHTCNMTELTGSEKVRLRARVNKQLPGIYNLVTRDRHELFVLGGATLRTETCAGDGPNCSLGPFVAKLDARTLKILWRTRLYNAKINGDWDYPGAIGVHGNGFVYVVNGYRVAKLDPKSGKILNIQNLPTPAGRKPGDTVYNGFSILADGNLIAKSMTRLKGTRADRIGALMFYYDNDVPSTIAVVAPDSLKTVASVQVREPVLGRITNGLFQGTEYIYVAGFKNLFRFVYKDNSLKLDDNWGPVRYCADNQKPATAPGIFNDFVVVQNNFQPASGDLSITVVSQKDSKRVFRITPFKGDGTLPASIEWSLPTLDAENNRIYSYDFFKGKLAAVDFDPNKGLSVAWKVNQRSLSFGAILGPKDKRVYVMDDANLPTLTSVNVIWRDAKTGKILAKSSRLWQGGGLPVTPGFDGVMYYLSHNGKLTELTPLDRQD